MACTVGSATQVSVHRPVRTTFFRPLFSIAATKFLSSHEFMVVHSIGDCFGKIAWTCGQRLPLKLLVSTVESTTGTSNTLVAFASATLLLMIDWRSKLATPNSICGWRSISVTTQLSGVSSPFSLRLARLAMSSSRGEVSERDPIQPTPESDGRIVIWSGARVHHFRLAAESGLWALTSRFD